MQATQQEKHQMQIADLKQFVDKTVILHMKDGETATVQITFLDEQDEELIVTVVASSSPDRQRAPCALHTFPAAGIAWIDVPS